MQRFFLPTVTLNLKANFAITKTNQTALWHQLKNVLRTKVGDQYTFFNTDSYEYIAELKSIDQESFQFIVQHKNETNSELMLELILIQAIPQKTEKWEWILQKGTELGVTKFVPLITERTQRNTLPKSERMQRILVEAVEQSGRTKVPEVESPMALKKLTKQQGKKLFFASLHSDKTLTTHLSSLFSLSSALCFIIGPEGGFTEDEENYLQSVAAIPYSLGPRVLRMETAAIVSVGIVTAY